MEDDIVTRAALVCLRSTTVLLQRCFDGATLSQCEQTATSAALPRRGGRVARWARKERNAVAVRRIAELRDAIEVEDAVLVNTAAR